MSEAAFRAVSADSHVNPLADMWGEYLPEEFRDRAPTVERTDEGDFEVFEGQRRPMMALAAAAGRRPEEYTMSVRRFDEVRAGGWEPGPRVEDQDIDGVDAEVLFGAAVGAPLPSRDPELVRAGYTAYNHWLADFCSYAPDRLIGMAYIPCDDPDGAIAEARTQRRVACGRGAPAPAAGRRLGSRGVGAAVAHDRGARMAGALPRRRVGEHRHRRRRVAGAFINGLVASKFNMPLSLGAIVFSGVLAEHPDLKLISVEGQIGWIPFWKYYIDHVYEKHRWHQDVHLPELPSTYIERQMWFTFMEDPPGIEARHACGVDRIMWSNDYPHSETTWPHSQKIIGDIFEHVPAEEVRKIVRDNCVELYGLD